MRALKPDTAVTVSIATSQRIRVSAGDLGVQVSGPSDATPVILNHAILTAGAMWRDQVARLTQEGWRVITLDARGHGQSDPMPPPYSFADLEVDNIAVLDALGIERAHFVGLSLGGMTGLGLGIAHPQRLLSLCLCDMRADAPAEFVAPWEERIRVATQEGIGALAAPTIARWLTQAFIDANPDTLHWLSDMIGQTSVPGFIGCARALQHLDFTGGLSQIKTPTTLIVGAEDGALPAAMRDIQSRIDKSVLESIPGAGHLPNIEQPALFNAALIRHLHRAIRSSSH